MIPLTEYMMDLASILETVQNVYVARLEKSGPILVQRVDDVEKISVAISGMAGKRDFPGNRWTCGLLREE